LGNGVSNEVGAVVSALAIFDDDLFVGGSFSAAGGKAATNFAIWRGERPSLSIRRIGNDVILSWPSQFTNYVLQSKANLSGDWSISGPEPVLSNDNWSVTNAIMTGPHFFRLRR
jgi:hypothetical protein